MAKLKCVKHPPRYNRNGILILDPPHESNHLPPSLCDKEHDPGPVEVVGVKISTFDSTRTTSYEQVCRRCGFRDGWRKVTPLGVRDLLPSSD